MAATSRAPFLRTSERRSFKRCPQQWWWGYREGLRAPGHKADALWFGTGIHLALAERYKYKGLRRGTNVLKVWREYVNDEIAFVRTLPIGNLVDEEPVWEDARSLGESMLGGYLDTYGKDSRWHFISVEQTFTMDIPRPGAWAKAVPRPLKSGHSRPTLVNYVGTFDGVARDLESAHEDPWLFEHKTAKAIMLNHLSLDDQAGSYWAVANEVLRAQKLIGPHDYLEGIQYNFLRKSKADDRPTDDRGQSLNKDGSVSKVQPSPRYVREPVTRTRAEVRTQFARIQAEALHMEAVRNKSLPLFKNPTADCSWGCAFHAMCELHESGDSADYREYRDAMFKAQDPYADHHKSTEE